MPWRNLAREMGFSLGKTNYCLRALMDKGLVKSRNFKKAKNRSTYAYILTPKGVEEKARVTYRFLKISANQRDQRLHFFRLCLIEISSAVKEKGTADLADLRG